MYEIGVKFSTLFDHHSKKKKITFEFWSFSKEMIKHIKKDMKSITRCSYCMKGGIKLLRCSRCKKALYCSKKCHATHWKIYHKKRCETPTQRACRFKWLNCLATPQRQNIATTLSVKKYQEIPNGVFFEIFNFLGADIINILLTCKRFHETCFSSKGFIRVRIGYFFKFCRTRLERFLQLTKTSVTTAEESTPTPHFPFWDSWPNKKETDNFSQIDIQIMKRFSYFQARHLFRTFIGSKDICAIQFKKYFFESEKHDEAIGFDYKKNICFETRVEERPCYIDKYIYEDYSSDVYSFVIYDIQLSNTLIKLLEPDPKKVHGIKTFACNINNEYYFLSHGCSLYKTDEGVYYIRDDTTLKSTTLHYHKKGYSTTIGPLCTIVNDKIRCFKHRYPLQLIIGPPRNYVHW